MKATQPDLDIQTPVAEAARRVIKVRLAKVIRLLTRAGRQTEEDDVEFVHQLRVAVRRALAALAVFRSVLRKSFHRKVRKWLQRLRRAGGETRNWDVFRLSLAQRLENVPDDMKPAKAFVSRQAAQGRADARKVLAEAARGNSVQRLRKQCKRLAKTLRRVRKKETGGDPTTEANGVPPLLVLARQGLFPMLDSLQAAAVQGKSVARRSASLFTPFTTRSVVPHLERVWRDFGSADHLHPLRLVTKRLRYRLESFTDCFDPGPGRELYPFLQELQERLGQVNDSRQIAGRLGELAAELEKGQRLDKSAAETVLPQLRALQQEYEAKRDRQGQEFLRWWQDQPARDLFARFRQLLGPAPPTTAASVGKPRAARPPCKRAETFADRFRRRLDLGEVPPPTGAGPRRIGAIDVGTNSIRLIVAEITGDGSYRILDDEREMTRLGRGLDALGRIAPGALEQSVQVLSRMKNIAEGYGVELLRAIGTCAVREAANRDEFLALVQARAGLHVEPISAEEEAQLVYLSVARAFNLQTSAVAVVDIGGGSTEVILSSRGLVEAVYSLPVGAVRLTERFDGPEAVAGNRYDELRQSVRRLLDREIAKPPFVPQLMIGTGGTFTSLAQIAQQRERLADGPLFTPATVRGFELTRPDVRHLTDSLRQLPLAERARVPGLSPERADIIVAGLTIVERLMKYLSVNQLQVHDGGVRDGLLRIMVSALAPHAGRASVGPPDPLRAVRQFAAGCNYEERHCNHVARLAGQLFDQLAAAGLLDGKGGDEPANRLLLEAAALLHDVGYLINYSKHHQHSYHLILHSDLPGLTWREIELVANVARYHRRAEPKMEHPNFAALPKKDRQLVRALTAILRVADGLDRGHVQKVRRLALRVEDGAACVQLDAAEDTTVEMWGAERKGRLFRKVFGLKLRLEGTTPAGIPQ